MKTIKFVRLSEQTTENYDDKMDDVFDALASITGEFGSAMGMSENGDFIFEFQINDPTDKSLKFVTDTLSELNVKYTIC